MSDTQAAQAQSVVSGKVERCKYGHEWRSNVELGDAGGYRLFTCIICGFQPKEDSKLWHEAQAILHLRDVLKPGDTVYTVLRHVSRSGMSRNIDLYYMRDDAPQWISAYVGHAIGSPQSRKNWERSQGLTVGGCGMDMGFHLVYNLGRVLFRDGFGEACRKCHRRASTKAEAEILASTDIRKNASTNLPYAAMCMQATSSDNFHHEFRGRNGDRSGWDSDGGYALRHQWL